MASQASGNWVPSERFERGVAMAIALHRGQCRKGGSIPYVSHLFAVSALVMEHGGSEDQAIAALLHDAIEDAGETEAGLAAELGPEVARIVELCSHDLPETSGLSYRERKTPYLEHVREMPVEALLVSLCDKVHNSGSILKDLDRLGADRTWQKFSGPKADVLWYYQELLKAYEARSSAIRAGAGIQDLVSELRKIVSALLSAPE